MNKVPSVVQILVAELLAVWGLSSFAMAVWNTVKPGRLEQIYLGSVNGSSQPKQNLSTQLKKKRAAQTS